jgi:two-component system OmpR family response regulator
MTQTIKVLIVDDDVRICELLRNFMKGYNIQGDFVDSGASMRKAMLDESYDVLLLDLMLPGEDGLTLCQEVRNKSDIPILLISARGEFTDRVLGLELGADDYIVKPFEPRELVARIHSILRRPRNMSMPNRETQGYGSEVSFEGWTLNRLRRHLTTPNQMIVPLSNAECRLLWVFIESPGRVLSRDQLMDATNGRASDSFDRSIDLLVSRLRQKLEDDPKEPKILKTVRGEGYVFDARVK